MADDPEEAGRREARKVDLKVLSRLGKFMYYSRVAKFYRDGNTLGFVFRPWHPLSWIMVPVLFIISVLMTGFPEAWKYREDMGLRMKPYFVEHPERLKWL